MDNYACHGKLAKIDNVVAFNCIFSFHINMLNIFDLEYFLVKQRGKVQYRFKESGGEPLASVLDRAMDAESVDDGFESQLRLHLVFWCGKRNNYFIESNYKKLNKFYIIYICTTNRL